MNIKRWLISAVAAFVFVFLFEWLIHGILLMEMYQSTQQIWRPMNAGSIYHAAMIGSQIAFALMTSFLFTRHYENRGVREGVRFGFWIGSILAAVELGSFCYLPIPFSLTFIWMVTVLLKGIGTGTVVALIYKN